jgi:hypothetical protein
MSRCQRGREICGCVHHPQADPIFGLLTATFFVAVSTHNLTNMHTWFTVVNSNRDESCHIGWYACVVAIGRKLALVVRERLWRGFRRGVLAAYRYVMH